MGAKTWGTNLFYGCTALEDLTIVEGTTTVPSGLCSRQYSSTNPNLKCLSLPSTLTSIGSEAFYNNTNLEEVVVSEGVTTIGASVFYGCSNLTEATLPNSFT